MYDKIYPEFSVLCEKYILLLFESKLNTFVFSANEDNQDLINLISKQKKKKKGGKGAKPIRAATSMGFHNKSGFGYAAHLRSPKPSFMYPASSARANPAKVQIEKKKLCSRLT